MAIVNNQRYSVKKKIKKKLKISHVSTHKSLSILPKNNASNSLEFSSKKAIHVTKCPNELIKNLRPCFVALDRMEIKKSCNLKYVAVTSNLEFNSKKAIQVAEYPKFLRPCCVVLDRMEIIKSRYFKYLADETIFQGENISKLRKICYTKRYEYQNNLRNAMTNNSERKALENIKSWQMETKSEDTVNSLTVGIDSNVLEHSIVLKNDFVNISNSVYSGNDFTNNKTPNKNTAGIRNMNYCYMSHNSVELASKKNPLAKGIKSYMKEVDSYIHNVQTTKHEEATFVSCDNKSKYENWNSIIKPCRVILTKIHFGNKNTFYLDLKVRGSDDFIRNSNETISSLKKESSVANVKFDSSNYLYKVSANSKQNACCRKKDKFNFNENGGKFEHESKLDFTAKTNVKLVTVRGNSSCGKNGKNLDQADPKFIICEENNAIRPCSVILKDWNSKNLLLQNDVVNSQYTKYYPEKSSKLNEIDSLSKNSGESNQSTYCNIDKHVCDQCGKILLNVKALFYHLCHGKKKRGFFCMFCKKTFDFYRPFKKHKCYHKTQTILSCSKLLRHRRSVAYSKKTSTEVAKVLPRNNNFSKNNSIVTRALSNKASKTLGNFDGKENCYSVSGVLTKAPTKSIFIKDTSHASTSKDCRSHKF